MNNLQIGFKPGAMLPTEVSSVKTWTDVTNPIAKATQIYFRALEANGLTDLTFKVDGNVIPVTELVGSRH